jgi:hypothetical protein
MSEKEKAKPEGQDNGEITFDLNFAPSWARTSPEETIQRYQNERFSDDGDDRRGGRSDYGRDRRAPRDYDSRERDRRRPSRRPPRREDDRDRDRGPRFADGGMPRPEPRMAAADTHGPRAGGGDGFRQERGGDYPPRRDSRRPRQDRRPETPALPLEIRVLPEQKALGAVIRRIQTSHRAYPLRDLASLFLDNPTSCLLRIAPLKDQQVPLFQCKVCGMPALSEEEIRTHLVSRHMDDFFDVEEVECEPPTGAFVCVARCGLSGELLGPPNHHSFNSKVQEMLRTRYATMAEEAYRARIETVRDAEVIEEWRQQCTKKKIYRRKGAAPTVVEPVDTPDAAEADAAADADAEPAPKAPAMERDIAELVFLREILPEQIASVRHLICTAAIGMQTPSRPLYFALRDMLQRERRFPASLFFALRGAFRHRKLHLFRVNDAKGPDFVMLKAPVALDPSHAVQTLRDVLTYVNEHPGCTKAEMVAEIAGDDEEKIKETLVQLMWLVERGHVVEFYNDVLSGPLDYPVFRLQPGEKQGGGRSQQATADQTPAPESKPEKAKPESDATQEATPEVAQEAEQPEVETAPAAEVAPEEAEAVTEQESSEPEAKAEEPEAEAAPEVNVEAVPEVAQETEPKVEAAPEVETVPEAEPAEVDPKAEASAT